MKDTKLLFTYGTLVKNGFNHFMIDKNQYFGDGVLTDYELFNVNGRYPGARSCKGKKVIGEIYEISDKTLRDLDTFEGNEYTREIVRVLFNDKLKQCYCYILKDNVQVEGVISSGKWYDKMMK